VCGKRNDYKMEIASTCVFNSHSVKEVGCEVIKSELKGNY